MPDDGERAALLGHRSSPRLADGINKPHHQRDGHAQMASGIANLSNTILGTGMLSFPLAMASAGIIPGILTCFLSGAIAALGLFFLSKCAAKAPHRRSSFFAVSQMTFPKAAVLFDAAVVIKCFGVSISYLIILKSLMPYVVKALYHVLLPYDPPEWALSGRIWLCTFMVLLVPLCFLRSLHSLRHTSYIALFAVAYLVTIIIVCYISPPKGSSPPGEIHLIHFTPSFISTFPIQVFAYTCGQNIFPIHNELIQNTQTRMTTIILTSIFSASLIYELVAILGYLSFGSRVTANIIAMYPSTTLFIAGGQLAIVVLVMFSYPLQLHPCRICLDKVVLAIFGGDKGGRIAVQTTEEEAARHEENSEDEDGASDAGHGHSAHDETSPLRHALLTAAIVIPGFVIAYFVNSLQRVLSFVGSTGSTAISFILPGLFFWKLFRDDPKEVLFVWLAKMLTLYGCCVMVFCLSFNIYEIAHSHF